MTSAKQAEALMQTGSYGRLALRQGTGDDEAARLSAARGTADLVDVERMPGRSLAVAPARRG